ncbi:MAG: type VI secretion system tube protein Hcp, partial [Planctomycetota bacterium]
GVGNSRPSPGSGGTTRGSSEFTTLQLTTTRASIASPLLWGAVARGTTFSEIELAVMKTFPKGDLPLIELEFDNALAVDYFLFNDDDGVAVETAEFAYEEMTYRFLQYDGEGELLFAVEQNWNVEKATSSPSFSFTASPSLSGPFLAADFNGDGLVDVGDLRQWQADFGVSAASDADFDGDSDGADFLAWQRQYGSSESFGMATIAVPEASSAALATAWLIGAAGVLVGRVKAVAELH